MIESQWNDQENIPINYAAFGVAMATNATVLSFWIKQKDPE